MKQPSIYLIGDGALWRDELIQGELLPWGHKHAASLPQADAVFLWVTEHPLSARSGFELGLALSKEKPILIGASSASAWNRSVEVLHLLPHGAGSPAIGADVRDAYEKAMADIDIRMPEVFRLTAAQQNGLCAGCGSSYKKGDPLRYSRYGGALHVDCYERRRSPGFADSAVFHAGLVEALREDNAKLEARIRELTSGGSSSSL